MVVLSAPAALHLSYTAGLGPVPHGRCSLPSCAGAMSLPSPAPLCSTSPSSAPRCRHRVSLGWVAPQARAPQCSTSLGHGWARAAPRGHRVPGGARGMATRAPLCWKLPVPECCPGLVQRWILSDRDRTFFHSRKMYNLLSVNKPDVCCCRAEHLSTSSDCKFWAADIWV